MESMKILNLLQKILNFPLLKRKEKVLNAVEIYHYYILILFMESFWLNSYFHLLESMIYLRA